MPERGIIPLTLTNMPSIIETPYYRINPSGHLPLVADRQRNTAYQKALKRVLRKGDICLDLGTGTGILSFFCLQAGAERVYAIERNKIIELARFLAKENSFNERIVFIEGESTKRDIPERVDIIVTETIGSFGLEEGIISSLQDACRRFLKPGGRVLPEWLRLWAVPVSVDKWYSKNITFWRKRHHGLRFKSAYKCALNSVRYLSAERDSFLSEPHIILHIRFPEDLERFPAFFNKVVHFEIEKEGNFNGILGWFEAGLGGKIRISNHPDVIKKGSSCHWQQILLPVQNIKVKTTDKIMFDIIMHQEGVIKPLLWETKLIRKDRVINSFSGFSSGDAY